MFYNAVATWKKHSGEISFSLHNFCKRYNMITCLDTSTLQPQPFVLRLSGTIQESTGQELTPCPLLSSIIDINKLVNIKNNTYSCLKNVKISKRGIHFWETHFWDPRIRTIAIVMIWDFSLFSCE